MFFLLLFCFISLGAFLLLLSIGITAFCHHGHRMIWTSCFIDEDGWFGAVPCIPNASNVDFSLLFHLQCKPLFWWTSLSFLVGSDWLFMTPVKWREISDDEIGSTLCAKLNTRRRKILFRFLLSHCIIQIAYLLEQDKRRFSRTHARHVWLTVVLDVCVFYRVCFVFFIFAAHSLETSVKW